MEYRPRLPREGVNRTPIHPLRESAVLLGGVVAVGALLLVVLGIALNLLLPHVSADCEMRLSRPFWAPGQAGQQGDPRHQALQPLVDRLAGHWSDNPYDLQVGLVEEPRPNAFAVPGGVILVTTGLLARTESENEVAFVLAHEIGHFAARDHLRRLGRGLLFAWVVGHFGGGVAPVDLVEQITARGFDRHQEAAADRFGLALVAALYGHVAGALDFFQRLPDATAGAAGDVAAYFSTHPVTRARLDGLRALARERGWPLTGPVQPLAPALHQEAVPDHEQGEGQAIEGRHDDPGRPQGAAVVGDEIFEGVEDHLLPPPGAGGVGFPVTVPYRSLPSPDQWPEAA